MWVIVELRKIELITQPTGYFSLSSKSAKETPTDNTSNVSKWTEEKHNN